MADSKELGVCVCDRYCVRFWSYDVDHLHRSQHDRILELWPHQGSCRGRPTFHIIERVDARVRWQSCRSWLQQIRLKIIQLWIFKKKSTSKSSAHGVVMERHKEMGLWISIRSSWRFNNALLTACSKTNRRKSPMEFCKPKTLTYEW